MRECRVIVPVALKVAVLGMVLLLAGMVPRAQVSAPEVVVYKTATCGCCTHWVDHMRANGFSIASHDVTDINRVKSEHGVPSEAASCHTAVVDGYVVEGHVPADAVQRLLRERPSVSGIAVPGMPAGSPGMELPSGRRDAYSIVTFDEDGQIGLFEQR
jgi:hypothetical protein